MTGLLLVNLGSPDSFNPKDVKRYLDEFLMDERVIDFPLWVRTFLVRGIILNTRPKKSAKAYKKIWWNEGSPLIVLTKRLQKKVAKEVSFPVEIAMRYGKPSLKQGLQKLHDRGVRKVVMLPLYPQFAMATTETITVLTETLRRTYFPNLKITTIPAFYNQSEYIDILSKSIEEAIKDSTFDYILFSYHGVPKRHIKKSDITRSHCRINMSCCQESSPAHRYCYRHHCLETTRKVSQKLNLKSDQFGTTFQSRLGVDPWLQPYTDQTISTLPQKGIKKLVVVTPAFVSDCLETLEEIGMEAKESFVNNGGESFKLIPCLNDRDDWAKLIAKWAKLYAQESILET